MKLEIEEAKAIIQDGNSDVIVRLVSREIEDIKHRRKCVLRKIAAR